MQPGCSGACSRRWILPATQLDHAVNIRHDRDQRHHKRPQQQRCKRRQARRHWLCTAAPAAVDQSPEAPSTSGSEMVQPRWTFLNLPACQKLCRLFFAAPLLRQYGDGVAGEDVPHLPAGEEGSTGQRLHVGSAALLTVTCCVQEGCQFLISTDERGRLDLRDTFVHDLETDIFARPDTTGEMPDGPSHVCILCALCSCTSAFLRCPCGNLWLARMQVL